MSFFELLQRVLGFPGRLLRRLVAMLRKLFAPVLGWADGQLNGILLDRLPPEIVHVPHVNTRRQLDPHGLTRFERTYHVSRQHPVVLVRPVVGLVTGLLLLDRPPGAVGAFVALAFAYVLYKRVPLRSGRRDRLLAAVLGVVIVVVAPELGAVSLIVLAVLVGWPLYDLADWWCEILVVTNKRVMLLHGILTVSRPSVKIRSIGFSNCISGPIGDIFQYGTIDLDTPSQRDKALSNLEYVPHAYDVWRLILHIHSEHFQELHDHWRGFDNGEPFGEPPPFDDGPPDSPGPGGWPTGSRGGRRPRDPGPRGSRSSQGTDQSDDDELGQDELGQE